MLALLYGALIIPVVLGLGWLAVRLRRDHPDQPGATALAIALVGCGGYAAMDVAEAAATTTTWKYIFVVAQTIPYELIGPAILVFSLEYTGVNQYVNRYLVAALAVVPTITILTLVAWPLAGVDLYFSDLSVEPYALGMQTLSYDPGPWFFVDGFNTVLLATLGAGQFLLLSIRSTGMYRQQGRLLFVGLLVPLLAGFANIVLFPDAPMDLAPPTFAVTWLAIGFALFRSELLAVVPVDWHSLIDQLAEAVFVVDPQGRIVQANAAAATLLSGNDHGTAGGIPRAAGGAIATASGGALVGASAATTLAETFDVDLETVDDGDVLAAESIHVPRDGDPSDGPEDRRFETRIHTVEDARGRQRGRLFLLYDVTDRVALEGRIRNQYEQLDVLNRLLRHDIRNDVAVAIGWGERLQADLVRDADDAATGATTGCGDPAERLSSTERLDHVDAVLTANRHIEELTLVGRDIARSVASDDDVELEPVDVGATLRNAVETAATSYEEAVFDEPSTYPAVRVQANDTLGSVFTNLLNNAIQHNDSDVPHVEVSTTVDRDTVTVVVADDGPGIPESRREAIFGRGEKGAESSGTGVGLYLVDQLVTEFGGTVHVEDAALGGASFAVELPLAEN